jgi:uncharacterized protein YndB with AHSA1/START domain
MSRHARFTASFIIALSLLLSAAAEAGIVDTSASGFTIRTTISVKGSPGDAYRIVSGSIAEWWHPDHTYSGDARNLSIDLANTGCFCEKLAEGGIVRHMTVVLAIPGQLLRLSGGLGPLQELGAAGTLTWTFEKSDAGTTIVMTYTAVGYDPQGLGSMAGAFDSVLGEQVKRLKNFIDTGKPEPAAAPGK